MVDVNPLNPEMYMRNLQAMSRNAMDGVPVKITLRPPKAVTIPSHFYKIDTPSSLEYEYDFSLESRVLEEARSARERQLKLEALRPTTAVPVNEVTPLTPSQPSSSTSPDEVTPPTPPANISITEFEPEAFSPFDQVELQTINDLEELHSIFGSAKVQDVTSTPTVTYATEKGATPQPEQKKNVMIDIDVLKNLFDDVQLAKLSGQSSAPTASPRHYCPPFPPQIAHQPKDHFSDLPMNLQKIAREIVSMGFPAERVSMAVLDLGQNKAKVIEHLCLIESLVSEGFDAKDASQALQFMGHDLTNSKKFLENMHQLVDVGFARGDIAVALKQHNNDRDKALDELLKA